MLRGYPLRFFSCEFFPAIENCVAAFRVVFHREALAVYLLASDKGRAAAAEKVKDELLLLGAALAWCCS